MIKILIVLVVFGCTVLSIKSILNKNKKAEKNKFYKTPKLSSLKGKDFSNYINNITKDL